MVPNISVYIGCFSETFFLFHSIPLVSCQTLFTFVYYLQPFGLVLQPLQLIQVSKQLLWARYSYCNWQQLSLAQVLLLRLTFPTSYWCLHHDKDFNSRKPIRDFHLILLTSTTFTFLTANLFISDIRSPELLQSSMLTKMTVNFTKRGHQLLYLNAFSDP